jgi:hypothetical protein
VDLCTIKAIEALQAQLRHATREAREIMHKQKQQLARNERVIQWVREGRDASRP